MQTTIQSDLSGVSPADLNGFFEFWPNPPSAATLHRILAASYRVSLLRLGTTEGPPGEVIGFAQAISDGILSASVPLLEVKAPYRGAGLGAGLMRHLLAQLTHLYAVDVSCDDDRVAFYTRLGLERGNAMCLRHYERQAGVEDSPPPDGG